MNAVNVGKTISKLRKKMGLTQEQLAKKLNVSDKAVSKWETGGGYPEITLLPVLSQIFGVSIDYLLKGDTQGIAIAGNILVDIVNIIDKYPEKNMKSSVLKTVSAVGGCVPNTIIDLAKIDSELYLTAYGKVGNDENGRYVLSQLKKNGIDVSGIKIDDKNPTSTSSVMTEQKTGDRTFFYCGGTNASFGIDDIDINKLDCKIFHIGYILLLDELDKEDNKYGTKMSRLLKQISDKGIKTSVDVISADGVDYTGKVIPVLKHCDYAIMNEIESCGVSGLTPRNSDGSINIENIKNTMELFIKHGVREKVIIHCSEAGFLMNADGSFYIVPSLDLPEGYIKGSVGAGDAYAAACLYGIYNGYDDEYLLEFASAAAACNLAGVDSVSGMLFSTSL